MRSGYLVLGVALILASAYIPAYAGKILLVNDEWVLRDESFGDPSDGGRFALNIATWFHPQGSGNFLVYSDNWAFSGSEVEATMLGAGHTWNVTTEVPFTISTLLEYDGVFLGGFLADNQVLIDYVNAGGNVYLCGGAGASADWFPEDEAGAWNEFLNTFGLGFTTAAYFDIEGHIPISSDHQVFQDIDHLYHIDGQGIEDLYPDDTAYVVYTWNGHDLFAIYVSPTVSSEPVTWGRIKQTCR